MPPSEPFIIVGMSMLEHIHFKAFLSHASIIFHISVFATPTSSFQTDGNDCGVFLVLFARAIYMQPQQFFSTIHVLPPLLYLFALLSTHFIHSYRIVMITLMIFVHEKELIFSRLFEMEDCGIFDNQTVPFSLLYASFLLECVCVCVNG